MEHPWTRIWHHYVRSPLTAGLVLATALVSGGATLPEASTAVFAPPQPEALRAGLIIYYPIVIPGYPVIILPPTVEVEDTVTVQFVAEGEDWATIYLDDRILFRALNTRRNYTVELEPGAYRLRITGTTQFDEWGAGYLDVGRDDAHVVVVRYSKTGGIRVSGDPYAWIPD